MKARPRVEKVESAIKGGVVAQLGQKTLILGRNGRGKSAIVNAIELAGTGRASDVAGRSVLAKDADLFMLAPPGAEKVFAEVRFTGSGEGKSEATWNLSKGHRATRSGAPIAFPLRDVQDALLGSPETARKWILARAGDVEWKEIEALVPASMHKRLGSLGGGSTESGGPLYPSNVDALIASLEEAKKKVRELAATAKAARGLSAPPQPPPSDQDITAIEAIIAAWGMVGAEEGEDASSQAPVLQRALAAAKLQAESIMMQAQEVERALSSLPAPSGSTEIRLAAVTVIEALARAHADTCAICGGKADPAALATRAARGRAKIEESLQVEGRRRELATAHTILLGDLASARREVSRLETEVARAEKDVRKGIERPSLSLEAARRRLSEMHTLRAGWAASKRSEEQALQAERESVEWDQLAGALSSALSTLVERARAGFESKVQRFLPRSDLFGIDLLDGDREILRVGLRRLAGDRMVLHAALSGAEWARVTAALALATAPEEGPCVVCPEERAFDPETLSEVLAAFDAALAPTKAAKNDPSVDPSAPQIIVTSPNAPDEVPAGWTVIELGDKGVTESVSREKRKGKGKGMERKEEEKGSGSTETTSEFEVVDGKMKKTKDKDEEKEPASKKPFDLFA